MSAPRARALAIEAGRPPRMRSIIVSVWLELRVIDFTSSVTKKRSAEVAIVDRIALTSRRSVLWSKEALSIGSLVECWTIADVF